jgi:hypothetical protein
MLLMTWNRDMRIESPFLPRLVLDVKFQLCVVSSLNSIAGEINTMIHLVYGMISISSAVITRPKWPIQSNLQILKVLFSSIRVKFVELDFIQSSIGVLLESLAQFPYRITSHEQLVSSTFPQGWL